MNEELRAKVKKGLIIGAFFGLALLFYALGLRSALTVYVMLVGALATLAILIQSGRGGGLAASLGGMGGESLLGVRSATPIAKATYTMLALFIFNCILLGRMDIVAQEEGGLLEQQQMQQQQLPADEEEDLGDILDPDLGGGPGVDVDEAAEDEPDAAQDTPTPEE